MYLGRIVEMGETETIFADPAHPYTRALLSAIPVPNPTVARNRVVLDATAFDRAAKLKEVAVGHWAAV
jgi:ABC-type oligopeptide transport system ATPase subunit